ncbi:MAG: oxidative damage protection protein [Legionellaceae bacterium]|nr:oxidative damage protection protein [Legionellaceae bacterium]
MTATIFCIKLKRDAVPLNSPPFPGKLGQQLFESVSKEAWKMWLDHQTMLINEYRLSLIDPKAREFLLTEMQDYFFGSGSEKPSGFISEEK